LDDVIGDVKSSVAMRRIEEGLSGLISKTETIIENKESSIHESFRETSKLLKLCDIFCNQNTDLPYRLDTKLKHRDPYL
jgi:hypothetical protein